MTITSFWFLVFIILGAGIYYLLPGKLQWPWLLALSIFFYCQAGTPYTIIYLVVSTVIAYASTNLMERLRARKSRPKLLLWMTMCAIFLNVIIWFVIKGSGLWGFLFERISGRVFGLDDDGISGMQFVAALGMGYYTLQVLGYIIDCYWESIKPQKNPLKLFLFVVYFPQLITGPISRYSQLEILFERHKFNYQNIAFGAQRILWGFVKKMVLAERIDTVVNAITCAPDIYKGYYSWIAILLYPVQMYADFSGCMDIVLGVSELFGIRLTENFNNPFFARTSKEFWQRWHITLGSWAKDYVLYPLLKSPIVLRFGKFAKNKLGKKQGKFLVNLFCMFVLWMVIGIWHGGYRFIVGVSLWYWVILMLGDLSEPLSLKITSAMKVKTESFAWHLFQSIRTYCIYAIGAIFFRTGIAGALHIIKDAIKVLVIKGYANPWIFFNNGILNTGVTYGDVNIIIIVVTLMFVVAALREKHGYARIWMAKQSVAFRWFFWISLFAFVLIWGKYGPGYDASEFIYKGF